MYTEIPRHREKGRKKKKKEQVDTKNDKTIKKT